eukprot:1149145-Pelagomonas_calceolata.AAC.9
MPHLDDIWHQLRICRRSASVRQGVCRRKYGSGAQITPELQNSANKRCTVPYHSRHAKQCQQKVHYAVSLQTRKIVLISGFNRTAHSVPASV